MQQQQRQDTREVVSMQEQRVQKQWRHGWRATLLRLAIATALLAATMVPHSSQAAIEQVILNGSFEGGFVNQPHCRWRSDLYDTKVGAGWSCFTNFGAARYGFYADTWSPVVADGSYSQLIEINTWGLEHGDNDRYAGIYQTVPTVAGSDYRLTLAGMIRTTNLDGDPWRYRVQVGYVQGVATDWRDVENWGDVGWDTYYPRTEPGVFSEFQSTIRAQADHMTLFIRVWKKWGLTNEELDVNLDAISMVYLGAPPSEPPKVVSHGASPAIPRK
jgi:hypothetical protein